MGEVKLETGGRGLDELRGEGADGGGTYEEVVVKEGARVGVGATNEEGKEGKAVVEEEAAVNLKEGKVLERVGGERPWEAERGRRVEAEGVLGVVDELVTHTGRGMKKVRSRE